MVSMDLLGKQGEEASERLNNVEQKIQQIDSHLNAVDKALQDFVDNYSQILEDELDYHESEILQLRKAIEKNSEDQERTDKLEKRLNKIEKRLDNHEKRIDKIIDSDLEKTFSDLVDGIQNVKNMINNTESDLEKLGERVDDVESELMVEINNRDFDFEKKLDKREYEEREDRLEEEVKKLRASVIFLADELDREDEIEVE
jgi:chromosome segregation ATPase